MWQLDEKKRARHVADELAFEYERARHRSQLKREAKADKTTSSAAEEGAAKPDAAALLRANELDLIRALHTCYFWRFWTAGFLSLLAEGISISSPLLTKEFLSYLTSVYLDAHSPGLVPPPPPIQYGLELAAALAGVQCASVLSAQ